MCNISFLDCSILQLLLCNICSPQIQIHVLKYMCHYVGDHQIMCTCTSMKSCMITCLRAWIYYTCYDYDATWPSVFSEAGRLFWELSHREK